MKNERKPMNHTQAVVLFMVLTVTLHVLGFKVNGSIRGSDLVSAYLDYGSKILGLILVLEMLLFSRFTPMKFRKNALSLNGKNDMMSLLLNGIIALAIVAGLFGFRLYMNAKNPIYCEIPLFGLYLNVHTRWLYPFGIVFQEFFIKSFTQENISSMLRDTDKDGKEGEKKLQPLLTALITAMFFFVLHLQYPLYYMCGAFLLCFVTGLLYEKDRNVWGAVMIHFAVGFMPRCLGILQIIEDYPVK